MSAELESRAQISLNRAQHLLDMSGEVYVDAERYGFVELPNDHELLVKHTFKKTSSPASTQDCTSIYAYSKDDPITGRHDCNPAIFCDFSKVLQGTYHGSALDEAGSVFITQDIPESNPLYDLIAVAFNSVRYKGQEIDIRSARVQNAAMQCRALLAAGGTLEMSRIAQQISEGPRITIETNRIEGDLPLGIAHHAMLFPALLVAVIEPPNRFQLEMHQDGSTESFERPSNIGEYLSRFARPQDVTRDDKGNITSVFCRGEDKSAVISAERAAGLRALDPLVLGKIETGLNLWRFDQTDKPEGAE